MGKKIQKLKKIRIHREGNDTLLYGLIFIIAAGAALWYGFDTKWPFWLFILVFGVVYGIVFNFYQCPVRYLNVEDTDKIVVAPADGKIVVIEEVEENEYFHDKRLQVSIFMSPFNVHANWYPIEGTVLVSEHQNGRHQGAWLPKSSTENERSLVVIETKNKVQLAVRQIAGAMARRIVTYAKPTLKAQRNEHFGFIKFGSRVDMYLPLDTEIFVKVGEAVTGNETIIGRLS